MWRPLPLLSEERRTRPAVSVQLFHKMETFSGMSLLKRQQSLPPLGPQNPNPRWIYIHLVPTIHSPAMPPTIIYVDYNIGTWKKFRFFPMGFFVVKPPINTFLQ